MNANTPTLPELIEANLPDPILHATRWLLWRSEDRKKVPYYADGARRQGRLDTPPDVARLAGFEGASDAYLIGDFTGLGVAMVGGSGIGGFDLDHCLDAKGELIETHAGFDLVHRAKALGAYIEISPSGEGLRIFGGCNETQSYSVDGVEYWGAGRYLTVTGNVWANPKGWTDLTDLRSSLRARTKPVVERDDDDDGDGPIVSMADLRDALSVIDADERDLWIRIGHALKTLPADKGKAIWLEWSAKSPKFDEAYALATWEGLSPTDIHCRSIFIEASENWGWVNPRRRKPTEDNDPEVETHDDALDLGDDWSFEPTEFVLDGFIPTGVSVIAGAWGAGKSTNLIPLLASAAHLAPEEWGFRPALRRHVIWITEAPDQAKDTIRSLARAKGAADWTEFREWLHLYPSRRKSASKIAARVKAIAEQYTWTNDIGFKVQPVVVLDTTSANLDLENENDNAQVGKAMAELKQSLRGAPLILIGHTPKMSRANVEDMTFRGAGAWEADAAATFYLVHDLDTDMRFMVIRKARFTPTYREVEFEGEGDSVMVPTPWGDPQYKSYVHGVPTKSSGEARKAAKRERIEERTEEKKEQNRTERQERILAFIRDRAADGRPVVRSTIREALGGKVELLYSAITRLIETDAIHARLLSKDETKAVGLGASGQAPELLLPIEVEFDAFLARGGKGNQS